jgi:putative serine protease PepD
MAPDELDQLRTQLEKQMKTANLKQEQRNEVIKGLNELVETKGNGLAAGMEKYTQQCDEFRKTLAQYKLDPGELLPPPAKTRLGVSISSSTGRMVVQRIAEKSRAQRIGLQEGDVIEKVDGKEMIEIADLRKAVAAKEKGIVMEVSRDGKDLKLEEKDAKEDKPAK